MDLFLSSIYKKTLDFYPLYIKVYLYIISSLLSKWSFIHEEFSKIPAKEILIKWS